MRNLEKEKEAYRRDLEDALENNYELKSLNTALRDDMQSAKAKFEKMSFKSQILTTQIIVTVGKCCPTDEKDIYNTYGFKFNDFFSLSRQYETF